MDVNEYQRQQRKKLKEELKLNNQKQVKLKVHVLNEQKLREIAKQLEKYNAL